MSDKKSIFKVISNILYYVVILFLLVVIAVSLFIPNGLVKVFGVGWYRVVSGSMEPLIMKGDFIIVSNDTNPDTYETGDIIIFETHFYNVEVGTYIRDVVTHHFYDVTEEGYIRTYRHEFHENGPQLSQLDDWKQNGTTPYYVTQDDLVGKHVSTIKMSTFTAFITSPYGIAVIVINVGLLIGLIVLLQHDKKKKSNQEVIDMTQDTDDNESSDDHVA